jgi:hypothetical protein
MELAATSVIITVNPRCLSPLISTYNHVVGLFLYRASHEKISILGIGNVGHCENQNAI